MGQGKTKEAVSHTRWFAWMKEAEREILIRLIDAADGSTSRMSRLAEISQDRVRRLLRVHELGAYAQKLREEHAAARAEAAKAASGEENDPSNVIQLHDHRGADGFGYPGDGEDDEAVDEDFDQSDVEILEEDQEDADENDEADADDDPEDDPPLKSA